MKQARCRNLALIASLAVIFAAPEALAKVAIDWTLAPPISGNGTYTGSVAGVGWTLTVSDANSLAVDSADATVLRGIINGSTPPGSYVLRFEQPVLLDWHNTSVADSVGGLSGKNATEEVDLVGGAGNYSFADNSANIPATGVGSSSVAPVFSTIGGVDLRASPSAGVDHAYYIGRSLGPQTMLRWNHRTDGTIKAEAWRVLATGPVDLQWQPLGPGSFEANFASVHCTLGVSNADSVLVQPGNPDLLRGTIGGSASTATYDMQCDRPVHIVFANDRVGTSVGGLAGLDAQSNEFIDLVGAVGNFVFEDNSINISAVPGASSVSPVFSTLGSDLRAESSPGVDHAYYVARSLSPQTSLMWTHNNAVAKAEVWRVSIFAPAPAVPAVPVQGRIALWLLLVGAGVALQRASRSQASHSR